MKGVVFTEFVELVEERFSPAVADRILQSTQLPSGGIYTSVGTYDGAEMAVLVSNLSQLVDVPQPELLKAFGRHLFGRFVVMFPEFFEGVSSSVDFLWRVDGYVHVEVRKLYDDAELPSFACERTGNELVMTYRSKRGLADLAHGLIEGCLEHFGDGRLVGREAVPGEPTATSFRIGRA